MADAKISALTSYTTPLAADVIPIIDTANGITKKITYPNLMATPNTRATYTVGVLDNSLVKTYFNIQLLFTLWTGSTSGALTTDFPNWVRSSADMDVYSLGAFMNVSGTGADTIWTTATSTSDFNFSGTRTIILDWFAKLPASGTGDISMGFAIADAASFSQVYNQNSADTYTNRILFNLTSTGVLYATSSKQSVGITNTDISSGLTLTNWNNYRIELHLGTDAKFYVNGVLKATLSGANLPTINTGINVGFGRSNTSTFSVTAPTLSLQMNP